jgi:nucleotide-binding universal stress UspA family protein
MYGQIIVGHDLHEGGADALALGRQIADAAGAKLVVAGVLPLSALPQGVWGEWHQEREVDTELEIERIANAVGAASEAFPSSSPARALRDLAQEIAADLIVVGSSHRGRVGQVLAGNIGQQLLHGSPCAIAIAPRGHRRHGEDRLSTITAGFDGSHESELALRGAFDLARASGTVVKVVAVAEPPPVVYGKGAGAGHGWGDLKAAIEQQLREQLDRTLRTAPDDVELEATLVTGEPAARLAATAAANGGLLFLGSPAYGPLLRVLLGSVSSALVRSAPCPILVHPRGDRVPPTRAGRAEVGTAHWSAA